LGLDAFAGELLFLFLGKYLTVFAIS
jgi:hypothetical protein